MVKNVIYYHASQTKGISFLEPRVSNHNIPLIYFSKKRENVLVYLSNAIEKYCKEEGFEYDGNYEKWGPYGFNKDGKLVIEEYYPNALESTYKNVSGYIYQAENVADSGFEINIPDAVTSSEPVKVNNVEYVEDAYEELMKAEKAGLITIIRYDEMTAKKKEWLINTIKEEYKNASNHPEYRFFLKGKFAFIIDEIDKLESHNC